MRRRIRYWIEDNGGDIDDSFSFMYSSPYNSKDLEDIATDAAQDYHSNHDGWEAYWPLTIGLAEEDGTLLGRVLVEREAMPYFSGVVL